MSTTPQKGEATKIIICKPHMTKSTKTKSSMPFSIKHFTTIMKNHQKTKLENFSAG